MLGCLSQSSGKWYKTASVVFKDSKEFPKYGITKVPLSVSLDVSEEKMVKPSPNIKKWQLLH